MFMLTLTTLKAVGGTIDIHLKDFPNAEKAGVTFTLYKVGSMSDDGKAALYEKYDMHLPDTAEGLQKVAKELTQKTDKETIGKRTTDEKGYLSLPILKMVSIYWCHPIWNLMARLILSL